MIRVCPHSDSKCPHGMSCTFSCATDQYNGTKENNPTPNAALVPHSWGPSRVGHGENQCKVCHITNREAWALGEMNHCEKAAAEQRTRFAAPSPGAELNTSPERVRKSGENEQVDSRLAEWGYTTTDEAIEHLGRLLDDQTAFDGLAAQADPARGLEAVCLAFKSELKRQDALYTDGEPPEMLMMSTGASADLGKALASALAALRPADLVIPTEIRAVVGEAVPFAWASEWGGIGGTCHGLHSEKHDAHDNAKWMHGRSFPLYTSPPAHDPALIARVRETVEFYATEWAVPGCGTRDRPESTFRLAHDAGKRARALLADLDAGAGR